MSEDNSLQIVCKKMKVFTFHMWIKTIVVITSIKASLVVQSPVVTVQRHTSVHVHYMYV